MAIKMSPFSNVFYENILLIVAGVALELVQVMQLFKLTGAIVGAQFIIKFPLSKPAKSSQIFKIPIFLLKALMFSWLFAYISICLDPPPHYVSKSKHFAYPTHPPPLLT